MLEKLMYKYLDTLYPNAYKRKSIFGIVHVYREKYLGPTELMQDLENCFGESEDLSKIYNRVAYRWLDSLYVIESIRNSTNNEIVVYSLTL